MPFLTPEAMRDTYIYLVRLRPFCRWNMPPASEVVFLVTRSNKYHGDCLLLIGGNHRIRLSSRFIKRTFSLVEIMAHEMVHIKCNREGVRGDHGPIFQKYAKQVYLWHGFDPGTF